MKPVIVLNFKTYEESTGENAVRLCMIANEVSQKTGVRVICCPPQTSLSECTKVHKDIYAQHVDAFTPGAHTGSVIPTMIKKAKATGSLINHAEKKVGMKGIKDGVSALKQAGLESLVCTITPEESASVAELVPTFIAVEPPELIGTGVSVSTAKPEAVTSVIEAVKRVNNTPVLCGAGISTASDVSKAIMLGAQGVLLASAYVKSDNQRILLTKMALAML